jgi:release factor glutamine methyltransferase
VRSGAGLPTDDSPSGGAQSRAGVTVHDALDSAVVAIAAAGSDTPRLDAELLLGHALGLDRAALVMAPEREVTGPAVRAFQDLVRRRSAGREPVAYLLGRRGFRRLELLVDGRVLVPRPETELLVEPALGLPHGARVVDVGTGSGAVALALKDERGDLDVRGTDVSEEALAVARANAARLGLDVTLSRADLLEGVGPVDAVLSNPPYVAEADRATLPPEVARHEPALALFGGPDGLDVVRRLVVQAGASAAALLALEVGQGQASAVVELVRAAGFGTVEALPDLAGVERVVVGRR